MKINGYTRSMSQKGCSPDNAACEGLFGRIKNEFFYNQDWTGVTVEEFSRELDLYLHWYNEKRIKKSLGYLSQWSTGDLLELLPRLSKKTSAPPCVKFKLFAVVYCSGVYLREVWSSSRKWENSKKVVREHDNFMLQLS